MATSTMQSLKSVSQNKSDLLGSIASSICLLHCLVTPFLFAAHSSMHHYAEHHQHGHSPLWWQLVDVVFLLVSLVAVYWSSKQTTIKWVKFSMFISWLLLALVILNEKAGFFHWPEEVIYLPTISLIGLHLYNRKYNRCAIGEAPNKTTVNP